MAHDPIAYVYEASEHCVSCALARFGKDENGFVPEDAEDNARNPVGAIFPWDEWDRDLTCGTCYESIRKLGDEEDEENEVSE